MRMPAFTGSEIDAGPARICFRTAFLTACLVPHAALSMELAPVVQPRIESLKESSLIICAAKMLCGEQMHQLIVVGERRAGPSEVIVELAGQFEVRFHALDAVSGFPPGHHTLI